MPLHPSPKVHGTAACSGSNAQHAETARHRRWLVRKRFHTTQGSGRPPQRSAQHAVRLPQSLHWHLRRHAQARHPVHAQHALTRVRSPAAWPAHRRKTNARCHRQRHFCAVAHAGTHGSCLLRSSCQRSAVGGQHSTAACSSSGGLQSARRRSAPESSAGARRGPGRQAPRFAQGPLRHSGVIGLEDDALCTYHTALYMRRASLHPAGPAAGCLCHLLLAGCSAEEVWCCAIDMGERAWWRAEVRVWGSRRGPAPLLRHKSDGAGCAVARHADGMTFHRFFGPGLCGFVCEVVCDSVVDWRRLASCSITSAVGQQGRSNRPRSRLGCVDWCVVAVCWTPYCAMSGDRGRARHRSCTRERAVACKAQRLAMLETEQICMMLSGQSQCMLGVASRL
eukprot:jgi/Ulvmu1/119/UM001_0123.1